MRRFNKKSGNGYQYHSRLPVKQRNGGLLLFGIVVSVVSLPERWTVGIQVVVSGNSHLAEGEQILILDTVHAVTNVMRDLRLQFADESLEYAHFGNGHESGLLQSQDMTEDRGEVVVDAVKAVIRPEFSSNMGSSQVCLQTGEFGQGLRRVDARRLPVHLIAATQARSAANLKLGHYQTGVQFEFTFE